MVQQHDHSLGNRQLCQSLGQDQVLSGRDRRRRSGGPSAEQAEATRGHLPPTQPRDHQPDRNRAQPCLRVGVPLHLSPVLKQPDEGVLRDLLGVSPVPADDREQSNQWVTGTRVECAHFVRLHTHITRERRVWFHDESDGMQPCRVPGRYGRSVSVVFVPAGRLPRWVGNFADGHGSTEYAVRDGALSGTAADGSSFSAALPFDRVYRGAPEVAELLTHADPPQSWGVLLVRKGGFAVARLEQERIVDSKVGQRHVQGRTKAGGQSQQRFARRRDNQARQAYEAAADHAARILGPLGRGWLVCGGDHPAVNAVLEDRRLAHLKDQVVGPWLAVPDPRRGVLETAIADAASVRIDVTNA